MRTLGSYAMVYITGGTGRFLQGRQPEMPFGSGNLLLLFPGMPHAYIPDGPEGLDQHYVVFEGPVFDLWRRRALFRPEQSFLRIEPVSYWSGRFAELVRFPRPLSPEQSLQHVALLQRLLADIAARREKNPVREDAWVDQARHLLSQGDHPFQPQEVARRLGLSYEHFRKQFRAQCGQSPARFRAAAVINRAAELMMASARLSNAEIADRLGFCDEFHFSRRFRELRGQSPREFRRQLPG